MLVTWKNKGLLVVLYTIVSFMTIATVAGVLHRNFGTIFQKIDFSITSGISCLIAALWTFLTKDDYYQDQHGNKKKLDSVNELFFISMKNWSYILVLAGFLFLANSHFHFF